MEEEWTVHTSRIRHSTMRLAREAAEGMDVIRMLKAMVGRVTGSYWVRVLWLSGLCFSSPAMATARSLMACSHLHPHHRLLPMEAEAVESEAVVEVEKEAVVAVVMEAVVMETAEAVVLVMEVLR